MGMIKPIRVIEDERNKDEARLVFAASLHSMKAHGRSNGKPCLGECASEFSGRIVNSVERAASELTLT